MKDWIWRAAAALFTGIVLTEIMDSSFRSGYNKAIEDAQDIIKETIDDMAPRIIVPNHLKPKPKKPSTIAIVRDFVKSAKKSNVIRELVTNPEDHSAYAYVEDGMIKIEIRNRMDH